MRAENKLEMVNISLVFSMTREGHKGHRSSEKDKGPVGGHTRGKCDRWQCTGGGEVSLWQRHKCASEEELARAPLPSQETAGLQRKQGRGDWAWILDSSPTGNEHGWSP